MARRGIALVVVVLALLGVGAVLLVGSGDETEYDPARVGQSLARATKVRSYYPCSDQGEAIVCEMRGPSLARYRVSRTKDACWRAELRASPPAANPPGRARSRVACATATPTIPRARTTDARRGRRPGRRPPPRRHALVRHPPLRERVGEDRRTLRPRGHALEAEAPQQRVLGRDARTVGEADRRAARPSRRVLGAGGLRAGDPRGEAGLEARTRSPRRP